MKLLETSTILVTAGRMAHMSGEPVGLSVFWKRAVLPTTAPKRLLWTFPKFQRYVAVVLPWTYFRQWGPPVARSH